MIFEQETDEELAFGRIYLQLIRRMIVRSQHLTDQLVRPHGLTGPQFLALRLIGNNEGLSQSDLVRLAESDPNTVSLMVRRLAERGLVIRAPHPNDGRAMTLRLTEEGGRLARAGLVEMNRLSRHLARSVPRRHASAIATWLKTVVEMEDVPPEE